MASIGRVARELFGVLRAKPWPYIGWICANLGGLLAAYAAVGTVFLVHNRPSCYTPGPEEVLVTGAISVAVAGVSYLNLHKTAASRLAPILTIAWAFLLALVYGVLVALGSASTVRSQRQIWLIVLTITFLCLLWSSITWLHEHGIRADMEGEAPAPRPVSPDLVAAASDLPKLQAPGGA